MKLRKYQKQAIELCEQAWASGHKNVLLRLPTGAGKTPTFGQIIVNEPGASVVIAHRATLVVQASLTLARYGIRHRVIGPKWLAKACASLHLRRIKRSFIDPNAKCGVATVGTLATMKNDDPWLKQIALWIVDEGHHLLRDNIWGKAVAKMTNARGLSCTATPGRPDGKGLGRHADGLIDKMVEVIEMGDLIRQGYLTPYKVYAPPESVDVQDVHIGPSGEFVAKELSAAFKKSKQIVGDVVHHYLKIARGKLGMTFAVDIEEAGKLAQAYRDAGVTAEVITGETDPLVRDNIMSRFERREVMQLVSVDILGEGTDVPAVEVVSMARHTNSFILFAQQLGRMVRLLIPADMQAVWDDLTDEQRVAYIASSEKPHGILIDHVGNIFRHGLPDGRRPWTLNRREKVPKGAPSDAIPVRVCTNEECAMAYERTEPACPFCGHAPEPASRATPEFVDGNLSEVDPAWIAKMGGVIANIDGPAPNMPHLDPIAQAGMRKQWRTRQEAQQALRYTMSVWAGWLTAKGRTDGQIQQQFFHRYGVDAMTAQSYGTPEANALREYIEKDLAENLVIDGTVNKRL